MQATSPYHTVCSLTMTIWHSSVKTACYNPWSSQLISTSMLISTNLPNLAEVGGSSGLPCRWSKLALARNCQEAQEWRYVSACRCGVPVCLPPWDSWLCTGLPLFQLTIIDSEAGWNDKGWSIPWSIVSNFVTSVTICELKFAALVGWGPVT